MAFDQAMPNCPCSSHVLRGDESTCRMSVTLSMGLQKQQPGSSPLPSILQPDPPMVWHCNSLAWHPRPPLTQISPLPTSPALLSNFTRHISPSARASLQPLHMLRRKCPHLTGKPSLTDQDPPPPCSLPCHGSGIFDHPRLCKSEL